MTDSHDGPERRRSERYRVNFRARWEGKEATRQATITDLSASGCFLLTEDLVKPGELIMIEMALPGGGEITLWGNVVYTAGEIGFAVRFSTLVVDADRQKLEWLIRAEALRARKSEKK